jgi:predicted ATP-grasp superfamily ATP-dependent carboligase
MTSGADGPALVIVGASVRAMADSATRVGFRVFAADLFGDHDLRTVATEVTTIEPYPDGIATAIARYPRAPVIYTGAIENHPSVIASLAANRPLAGCGAEAVTQVRDARLLARAVRKSDLFFPETRRAPAGLPVDGTWLVKPVASAGGRGIHPWFGQDTDWSSHLWQKRVSGRRLSVGYLVHAGQHQIIAASRQLVGHRWCRANTFAYCGSIDLDLTTLDANIVSQGAHLGELLAGHFGLAGLVGADLLVDAWQRVWVIEINPRPTASMELIERATGCSLAAMHLAAFGIECPVRIERRARTGTWAKAILFARHDGTFDEGRLDSIVTRASSWTHDDGWPAVADLPEPPCRIRSGSPVCTLFAHGPSPRAALRRLRDRVAAIENVVFLDT